MAAEEVGPLEAAEVAARQLVLAPVAERDTDKDVLEVAGVGQQQPVDEDLDSSFSPRQPVGV